MKKLLIVLVLAAVLLSCKSTGTGFSSVAGKEWKLIEVRIDSPIRREILFDRSSLSKENAGNAFTLRFDNGNLNGTAAPNRFSAPYTLGQNENDITISPMRSTQNPSRWQPERIREPDFFQYVQNIYRWELNSNGNLVLFSRNEEGQEVRMMFS